MLRAWLASVTKPVVQKPLSTSLLFFLTNRSPFGSVFFTILPISAEVTVNFLKTDALRGSPWQRRAYKMIRICLFSVVRNNIVRVAVVVQNGLDVQRRSVRHVGMLLTPPWFILRGLGAPRFPVESTCSTKHRPKPAQK